MDVHGEGVFGGVHVVYTTHNLKPEHIKKFNEMVAELALQRLKKEGKL